jgi:hypothetical protein
MGDQPKRSRGHGLLTPALQRFRTCSRRASALEDLRSGRVHARSACIRAAFLTLGAVPRHPPVHLLAVSDPHLTKSGTSRRRAASPGFVQRSPLRRTQRGSPLRADAHAPTVGTGLPPPVHVPSSWFRTTSTACSSCTLRAYCSALPTMGFTAFQEARSGRPARDCPPRDACLPSEAFPPPAAAGVATCGPASPAPILADRHRSPQALPPRPSPPRHSAPDAVTRIQGVTTWKLDLEALLHERVRCRPGSFPPMRPGASLGLPGTPLRAGEGSE